MKHNRFIQRCMSLLLSLALISTLLPAVTTSAKAGHWAQSYMDTIVEWGVMRDDIEGNLDPDAYITRAEFVSMINRAFGYNKVVETPFTDVPGYKWYSDDIAIAYGAGYFKGTGDGTTAHPEGYLTREQAAYTFALNLGLKARSGEALGFKDSRDFGSWSRGMVAALIAEGIITGLPDGTFLPQDRITRAQVSCMLVRALGTLLHEEDTYSLGGVYDNVTISSSGSTLRDTIIAGNLYLTGGIDLGDVLLENVTVLGKIVVGGGGESSGGRSSITLRNVTADEMVVDNIANQFITINADGDTSITTTNVRSSAYIQDLTTSRTGLKYINLEGEEGSSLTLAGGIKSVTNLTPNSTLSIAQGFANEVTIDENATNSVLRVENGAYANNVNLDIGTTISGTGDIANVTVNASGVVSEILPDTITVRPGLTANIAGETMDTVTAAESSADPRLLTGYPKVTDIAPTTAQALFSTNKRGTVYWAITAIADGSVDEEDLIKPPSYSGAILSSGNIKVTSSNREFTVKLSKLTSGGSYYLSAILVDSRGQRSPLKVVAFTTPDSSTPSFASGFPYMSRITNNAAQVTVMTTKTCQLYYALLPKGAGAPNSAEFKANAVSGNLGYGSLKVTRNIPAVFYVNNQALKELQNYDLYLWLTDFDGAKSSAVKKVSFTTIDGTSPIFLTEPMVTSIKATSVGLKATLNEKGTVYWAVVKHGDEYPKPLAGQTVKPALDSETAKLQVVNGMNCLKSGKVSASANKDFNINISGLSGETSYDLYYVAVDSAGNYSTTVKMITINTLDTVAPTVTQSFSSTADETGEDPMPDTDVILTFSEGIQYETGEILVDLYATIHTASTMAERRKAEETLIEILRSAIKLYDASSYPDTLIPEKTSESTSGHWISYDDLSIAMVDGQTVITFENGKNINLKSGGTYYFKIADLYDTSNNKNSIKPNPQALPEFTTVFAQATLTNEGLTNEPFAVDRDGKLTSEPVRVDMSFQVHPTSTENVDDSIYYDVFLWTDSYLEFDVYARSINEETHLFETANDPLLSNSKYEVDKYGWVYLGNAAIDGTDAPIGISVHDLIDSSKTFTKLNGMNSDCTYEYAISLTMLNDLTDWQEWSGKVTFGVTVPAGKANSVDNLAASITEEHWASYLKSGLANGGIRSIGSTNFSVFRQFQDTKAPSLRDGYPAFLEGDTFVTMTLQANREGTVYYVLAPVTKVGGVDQYALTAYDTVGAVVTPDRVPGGGSSPDDCPTLTVPTNRQIYSPSFSNSNIKTGKSPISVANTEITVSNLLPNTMYYVYLVTKGDSANYSPVYLYQFTTQDAETPEITLTNRSPSVEMETSATSELHYALVAYNSIPSFLSKAFSTVATPAYTDDSKIVAKYETDENKALDGKSTSFSVLDAMLTSCSDVGKGQKSVFDVYAKSISENTIREIVAEYIREKDPNSDTAATARGSIPVILEGGTNSKTINFSTYMTSGTQYYCLTAAHNTQGTMDGFKAIKNIHLPDSTPPAFVSVTTAAKPDGANTYNGTVTITFSEPIYFIAGDSADPLAVPVWYSKYNTTEDQAGMVYFSNHITKSGFSYTCTTKNSTSSSITLSFSGISDGDYLIMFSDGFISDSNSNAATRADGSAKTLTLTFYSNVKLSDIDPDYADSLIDVTTQAFIASWK